MKNEKLFVMDGHYYSICSNGIDLEHNKIKVFGGKFGNNQVTLNISDGNIKPLQKVEVEKAFTKNGLGYVKTHSHTEPFNVNVRTVKDLQKHIRCGNVAFVYICDNEVISYSA